MTTAIIDSRKQPLQLRWEDRGNQVTVTPEDGDRFIVTAEELLTALKGERARQARVSDINTALKSLIGRLDVWLKSYRQRLRKAFLTARDGAMLFLVETTAVEYDADIENSLIELEIAIAKDEQISRFLIVDALAIPTVDDEHRQTFLSTAFTMECKLDG